MEHSQEERTAVLQQCAQGSVTVIPYQKLSYWKLIYCLYCFSNASSL